MFSCVNAGDLSTSSQFNPYTVKPPKQAYGLIFFKIESKGDFKIVMQIYVDECIMFSLCLDKKSLKVFNRTTKDSQKKNRNVWAYKQVSL